MEIPFNCYTLAAFVVVVSYLFVRFFIATELEMYENKIVMWSLQYATLVISTFKVHNHLSQDLITE
jgi:hypothetical protein